MIPIYINTAELAQEFSLSRKQIDGLLSFVARGLTARLADLWANEAKKGLHQTRTLYTRALYVGEQGRFTGVVILRGRLPNMIENGASAFDMKVGFQGSSKIHTKKESGWYLTIPFRWATPGALGESTAFAGKMPSEVWMLAKNLSSTPGTGVVGEQLKQGDIPSPHDIPKVRPEVIGKASSGENKVFTEYKNKSSVFAGIGRESKTYKSATQGKYVSFRRVSDQSDPMSWVHTGLQARKFADAALAKLNIPKEVDVAIDNYLASVGL